VSAFAHLADRSAVVTGSTRGIGEAIARELFTRGARVVVTGPDAERAEAIAKELDPSGARAKSAELDVRRRGSIRAAIETAVAAWGSLDILVNNAGVTPTRSFFEIEDDEWDDVLATNLRSIFIGCQLAGTLMRERGYGRIINHASIAGQQGGAVSGAHYAASKAGILVITKIVARELARYGVTVNAIAPAAIAGPIMDEMPAETIEGLARAIPVGRLGRAEEVAAAVAFLASDHAGYITGATLDINGGLFMR
jgi:3-oxoacyl-[acyl-carrier protein] reductase